MLLSPGPVGKSRILGEMSFEDKNYTDYHLPAA